MVAVLLTTFSVLALVSARADLRLSDKAADSVESYYAADGEAEKWLAAIDVLIQQTLAERPAAAGPVSLDDFTGALSSAGYEAVPTADGRAQVSATFVIDERRDLVVEIALDSAGEIDILRWQTVPKR
jgi:hypothetical protein